MTEDEFRMKLSWPLAAEPVKPSFWLKVRAWLTQSSTIGGIAALAGDVLAVATGAATWRAEVPIAGFAIVLMVLPGNTGAAGLLMKMLRDLIAAIASKDAASIGAVVADAEALLVAGGGLPALPSDAPATRL